MPFPQFTLMLGAVDSDQVDSYPADGTSGWSILVQGPCSEITEPADLAAAEATSLRAWASNARVAQRLVCLETSFLSGRWFQRGRT